MSARPRIVTAVVALAVAGALPLVPAVGDSSKWMTIAILTFVVAALASSWNILGGFAGQISLGQAAFFGVGAHITRETWLGGWPLPLSLFVGAAVTMVGAAVIGVPMLRLRGIYFSIGTLAAAEALRITVGNLRPGISALPADALATYTYGPRYYLALGVLALAVALAMWLRRSKLGLGMMTQRDDEQAAGATGVNVFGHRMAAFVLSAGLAALAGGAFAYFFISYYPVYPFTVVWSFDAILVTFIGGFGTIVGPIIGSVFFVIVRDALSGYLAEFQVVGFGVLFILVVILFPGGIVEAGRRLAARMSPRGIEDPDKEREETT